jgi:hypothetical protein
VIVSHEHRFIFLKTRKTAGTSVELLLSRIAGPDAIVTPITPEEPGHEPRSHKGGRREELRWLHANPKGRARSVPTLISGRNRDRRRDYYNHMPAWLVRAKVGETTWNDYFKFCFERNPWDKVLSLYWWVTREDEDPPSFSRWLRTDSTVRSDWSIYSIRDELAMDSVGRYESLGSDLRKLLGRVGLDVGDFELPRAKQGVRQPGAIYSPADAELVRRIFGREVAAFGYEPSPTLLQVER